MYPPPPREFNKAFDLVTLLKLEEPGMYPADGWVRTSGTLVAVVARDKHLRQQHTCPEAPAAQLST